MISHLPAPVQRYARLCAQALPRMVRVTTAPSLPLWLSLAEKKKPGKAPPPMVGLLKLTWTL